MKRPSADQLRGRVGPAERQTNFDDYRVEGLTTLAIIAVEALINISETLEDIAAGLDRERLGAL